MYKQAWKDHLSSRHRPWEKGASWRAQGWVGENATAATVPCTPRKSQKATIHIVRGREQIDPCE